MVALAGSTLTTVTTPLRPRMEVFVVKSPAEAVRPATPTTAANKEIRVVFINVFLVLLSVFGGVRPHSFTSMVTPGRSKSLAGLHESYRRTPAMELATELRAHRYG